MIDLALPLTDSQIAARFDETMRARLAAQRQRRSLHPAAGHRGIGDLTYDPAATPEPSFVVIVSRTSIEAGGL
jgi:hypothetical protein